MRFLRFNTARFVLCLLAAGSPGLSSQMSAQELSELIQNAKRAAPRHGRDHSYSDPR
jgi:hypothetical protein